MSTAPGVPHPRSPLPTGWRRPCMRCRVDRHDRCSGPFECGCQDPSHRVPEDGTETPDRHTITTGAMEWTGDMIRMIAEQDPRLAQFDQWLAVGIEKGWVSFPVCSTHDFVPLLVGEQERFEEGGDPCITVARIWEGAVERGECGEAGGRGLAPVPTPTADDADGEDEAGANPIDPYPTEVTFDPEGLDRLS